MDEYQVKAAASRWAKKANCTLIGRFWMTDHDPDVEAFSQWFYNTLEGVLKELKRGNPRGATVDTLRPAHRNAEEEVKQPIVPHLVEDHGMAGLDDWHELDLDELRETHHQDHLRYGMNHREIRSMREQEGN